MKAPNSSQAAALLPWVVAGGILWGVYRFFNPDGPDPGDGPAGPVDPLDPNDPVHGDRRPATFTSAQAVGLANAFYAAVYGGFIGEDENAMVRILTLCEVTDDVRLLINAYGSRETLGTMELDLPGAVVAYLEPAQIAAVNSDYAGKSIIYRF